MRLIPSDTPSPPESNLGTSPSWPDQDVVGIFSSPSVLLPNYYVLVVTETKNSICRVCTAHCQILVEVEGGRAVKVFGDPESEFFGGYTCPKGRALPEQHYGPNRLRHSMKREGDAHVAIGSAQAMDEIAEKVQAIVEEHGPRSVALYTGTGQIGPWAAGPISVAWLMGLGSQMHFTSSTIDQPGKHIAMAAHGLWAGGEQAFDDADTWILIGTNPAISKIGGVPGNNPSQRLKKAKDRGLALIVIDPRRTEAAKRARIHLQVRPGEDPTVLAAMLRVIIEEGLHDQAFIDEDVDEFQAMRDAVEPFTPEYAAERAGVSAKELVEAARVYARGTSGAVTCGTGPNMATHGSLTEYLSYCLMSVCGRWPRAGERVAKPNVLMPTYVAKAQAKPPYNGFQYEELRVRGLCKTSAGMPTAALADEILLEGDGQVRVLICMGGNPMMAWPDQRKTFAAMQKLELLITLDYHMSATAELADYVIAPKLSLETPGMTQLVEVTKFYGYGLGFGRPYGSYASAAVDPPEGSDLLEEWEFFYGLAQRMGKPIFVGMMFGWDPMHLDHHESPPNLAMLDMANKPSTDDVYEVLTNNSRIPLSEVKKHPHGHIFETDQTVQPKDEGFEGKLCVGDAMMVQELGAVHEEDYARRHRDASFPFVLVCRRANAVMNSAGREIGAPEHHKPYNPAFMHPDDLADLGLSAGDTVKIASPHDFIYGIVESDDSLRRGVVSMTHAYGGNPGEDDARVREIGSCTARLSSVEQEYDPVTGIPRMSAIPVRVELGVR